MKSEDLQATHAVGHLATYHQPDIFMKEGVTVRLLELIESDDTKIQEEVWMRDVVIGKSWERLLKGLYEVLLQFEGRLQVL